LSNSSIGKGNEGKGLLLSDPCLSTTNYIPSRITDNRKRTGKKGGMSPIQHSRVKAGGRKSQAFKKTEIGQRKRTSGNLSLLSGKEDQNG